MFAYMCDFDYHRVHRKPQHDARGIFLCYTCAKCHKERMAGFRADVIEDPNYWHDEPIEEL